MNSLKGNHLTALSIGVVGATFVGFGIGSAPAEAATVFTDQAAFLSNLQSSYLETFDSLPTGFVLSPRTFSQSGFSYEASAAGGLFAVGPSSNPSDLGLSPAFQVPLVFNFTSGNISAVGGAFFPGFQGNPRPGSITLTLSDGTTQVLTNTNNSSFIGFIADPGTFFTSLNVVAGSVFPYADDLRVGAATPIPIPTPALLPGLIGLGLGVWRKRKAAAAETDSEA